MKVIWKTICRFKGHDWVQFANVILSKDQTDSRIKSHGRICLRCWVEETK